MAKFVIPPELLTRRIAVTVVGAGGNGSRMLTGLAELDRAMRALGHPGGMKVTVIDDDLVSESNIGRQAFFPSDVGIHKAVVLTHRINMSFGLDWTAEPVRLTRHTRCHSDILIGAVDSRAARREIHESMKSNSTPLYLDLGNQADSGQVILGEPLNRWQKPEDYPDRLPTITDLFPEILDTNIPEDNEPSCSMVEALSRQELYINRVVSDFALNMLWRLFRYGEIDHHGAFINLSTGRTMPLAIDPDAWARFGYVAPTKKRKQRRRAA